jgi:hypothetical protein
MAKLPEKDTAMSLEEILHKHIPPDPSTSSGLSVKHHRVPAPTVSFSSNRPTDCCPLLCIVL